MRFGFWTDLASLRLDDQSTATWIQAMPLGKYNHPVYGEIEVTPKKVQQFADNVKNNVRGTQLDIDYDHKKYDGGAAGWVQEAEARPDGLWILVEWTKEAYQKLKDKAYRYFSPEFLDEWTHPKTEEKYKNVLAGGAITNRPFLKDIVPINLSELVHGTVPIPAPSPTEPPEGGEQEVDGKELRKSIGLAENATDDEVAAKLAELKKLADPPAPTPEPDLSGASLEAILKSLTDLPGNPAVKQLTDLVKAQQKQMGEQAKQLKEIQVERQLADLDRGKKFTVPPVVKDKLREVLLTSDPELANAVFQAYQQTLELGLVDMTERGWQRRGDEQSPAQKFLTEVDVLMKQDEKLTYAAASARVAALNPQLAEEYRKDSYIPSEGR